MLSVGRPTKYNEEVLSIAQFYVQQCQHDQQMPFIEELALALEVNEDTVVEWAKEHDEFSVAVKKLKMLQKLYLKKGALGKKLHPSLSIFLLKANHGMNEEDTAEQKPMEVIVKYV